MKTNGSKTKTYEISYRGMAQEFIVEELTRKEFIEIALETIDGIEEWGDEDSSVYVLYKDGREFMCSCGSETVGKFMRSNIQCGVIVNSATQQVFGQYLVDENGLVQPEIDTPIRVDIEIGTNACWQYGYVIWTAGYKAVIKERYGFASREEADNAAEMFLNTEYGENGWYYC